ncbi:MAG TPA: alanine racemase [Gemmatimonadaceae bacterium]|jgi:alanine racemase|nr:alanine racemase [Gemmatimonadaceae bacterium]
MIRVRTRAWVEIDLGALTRNARRIAEAARVPLLPVVKADAYGLGAVGVARALEQTDPWGYGVGTIEEGEELRGAGITRPVLVLTPILPETFDAAQRAGLRPALGNRDAIAAWGPTGAPWHLSIDTGMNRAGVPWREVASMAGLIAQHPPEGAFTHFHSVLKDRASVATQTQRFVDALARLSSRPAVLHAESSAAIEHGGGPSRWNLVRPGIFLFGVGTTGGLNPEAVVSVRARIVELRQIRDGDTVSYGATWPAPGSHPEDWPRRIATLPLGYADGYRRALGNRGWALLHGRRVPVAGAVTMDMTMLDVTDVTCEVGDVVTLIGRDGDELITVQDAARAGHLSPYELLTELHSRLPRLYVEGGTSGTEDA